MGKEQILDEFKVFCLGTDGIVGWLGPSTDARVFDRLVRVEQDPLAKVQLNQLLAFGHEAPLSDDFFRITGSPSPRGIRTTSPHYQTLSDGGSKPARSCRSHTFGGDYTGSTLTASFTSGT